MTDRIIRVPASSANLGAGFDIFGMALELYADVGLGSPPSGAVVIDERHPARTAFALLGGVGDLWLQTSIPMARGLGFSGAIRVGGAALAVVQQGGGIVDRSAEILAVTAQLEGHGDNVAASLFGGVTAYVEGRAIPFVLGPILSEAALIAWVPDVTTSTDSSRKSLPALVDRAAAVHNIGRATQFALAFAHDDPAMLIDATQDRLHQSERIPMVPDADEAIAVGVGAGAWCAWLSGSGPTVAMLADRAIAADVVASLPTSGHSKVLAIDHVGARTL